MTIRTGFCHKTPLRQPLILLVTSLAMTVPHHMLWNRTKQKHRFRPIRSVQFYSAPPRRPAIAPNRSRSAFSLMNPWAST